MKGYLERIAASAVRPRGTIHAFAGSMFSAPRREPANALPRFEEWALEDAGEPTGTTRDVAEPASDMRPGVERARGNDRRGVRPTVARSVERVPFEPLLPKEQTDAEAPAVRGFAGVEGREGDAQSAEVRVELRKDRPEARPGHRSGEKPAGELSGERLVSAERLVSEDAERLVSDDLARQSGLELSRAVQQIAGESRSAVGPNPARGVKPEFPPHVVSPAREPDEIQIHIGRIEVTAVQQAARPAPTPARKAMSLDEYLSRRDGRAG